MFWSGPDLTEDQLEVETVTLGRPQPLTPIITEAGQTVLEVVGDEAVIRYRKRLKWCKEEDTHCKEPILKVQNKYSQKRNCAATVSISTFMCLWAIYI
jgi:hypothetical protein